MFDIYKMSSYSNITPRIVDSVFDRANLRAEYRLPSGQVYLSTMRLSNVGFSGSGSSSYNKLLGAYGAIRQISLYDGSQLLEQVKLAPQILAFKNAQQRNDESISMNRKLKHTATGYVASGVNSIDAATAQFIRTEIKVREQEDEARDTGKAGWLSLKDVFSFLDRSIIVPTGIFTQFRLVVEYNSDAVLKNLASANNQTFTTLTTGLLLVDEVNEGETRDLMMKNYQGVAYRPLEIDTVVVPTITGLADTAADNQKEQSSSFLLNGFVNKRVVRAALIQEPTDATTWQNGTANTGFGPIASSAQLRPQFQFRINGANKLSADGVSSGAGDSSANRALSYLVDTWGDFTMVEGQHCLDQYDFEENVLDATLKGTQQYLGLAIDERINELQLQYSRTGHFGNTQSSQQLRLHVMGEVERAVILGQGGYNVVYA